MNVRRILLLAIGAALSINLAFGLYADLTTERLPMPNTQPDIACCMVPPECPPFCPRG